MCLAVPGKLVETFVDHDVHMGRVDFGGKIKRVCLEHVPEAQRPAQEAPDPDYDPGEQWGVNAPGADGPSAPWRRSSRVRKPE